MGVKATMLAVLLLLLPATRSLGSESALPSLPGLSATVRALAYGTELVPSQGTQNPDNGFLQIERYSANAELRPDVLYDGEVCLGGGVIAAAGQGDAR